MIPHVVPHCRLTAAAVSRTAPVAQQFAASFTVVHSDGDADTLYDGSLVKTLDADGEWVVSGSLTVSSESHAMATTYTFLDDKGYYQVRRRGSLRPFFRSVRARTRAA